MATTTRQPENHPRGRCYIPPVTNTQRQLAALVDAIVESYAEQGNINHLDGSNLPSREAVDRGPAELVAPSTQLIVKCSPQVT